MLDSLWATLITPRWCPHHVPKSGQVSGPLTKKGGCTASDRLGLRSVQSSCQLAVEQNNAQTCMLDQHGLNEVLGPVVLTDFLNAFICVRQADAFGLKIPEKNHFWVLLAACPKALGHPLQALQRRTHPCNFCRDGVRVQSHHCHTKLHEPRSSAGSATLSAPPVVSPFDAYPAQARACNPHPRTPWGSHPAASCTSGSAALRRAHECCPHTLRGDVLGTDSPVAKAPTLRSKVPALEGQDRCL